MNKAFTKNNLIQVIKRFTRPNILGITTCDVCKQEKDSYDLYTVKHWQSLTKLNLKITKTVWASRMDHHAQQSSQDPCLELKVPPPSRMDHHAEQSSQEPCLELKVPPPRCCAYSEITVRAHTSQVFATSLRDIGCDKPRKDALNFDFDLAERSSFSILTEISNNTSLY